VRGNMGEKAKFGLEKWGSNQPGKRKVPAWGKERLNRGGEATKPTLCDDWSGGIGGGVDRGGGGGLVFGGRVVMRCGGGGGSWCRGRRGVGFGCSLERGGFQELTFTKKLSRGSQSCATERGGGKKKGDQ